jgi:hypothetical protein
VAYATKHDATAEIAEKIGQVLHQTEAIGSTFWRGFVKIVPSAGE